MLFQGLPILLTIGVDWEGFVERWQLNLVFEGRIGFQYKVYLSMIGNPWADTWSGSGLGYSVGPLSLYSSRSVFI